MKRRKTNRRRVPVSVRLRGLQAHLSQGGKRLLPYSIAALILVAVPFGIFSAYSHVVSTEYFAVEKINVDGNSRVETGELLRDLALAPGINVFDVDAERLEQAATTNPWIESASVVVTLPRSVSVKVKERSPSLLANVNGQKWLIDRRGNAIVPVERLEMESIELPYLSGFEAEVAVPSSIAVETLAINEKIAQLEWSASEYHFDSVLGFSLMLDNGVEVRLGHDKFEQRLARAKRVLETRDEKVSYILVDHDLNAGRVVVGEEVANYHGR